MSTFIDLIGKKFGKLTVVKRDKNARYGQSRFLCHCDCGKEKVIRSASLKRGNTKSCGCISYAMHYRHGMYGTPVYRTWNGMLQRCGNPKKKSFKNYGGRGITVCDRWHSFENFFTDMGHPPSPKHSIERINNNGNYKPKNCKWSTNQEQCNNTRRNQFFRFNGQCKNLQQWSDITGLNYCTLRNRLIIKKWPIEKSLTTPADKQEEKIITYKGVTKNMRQWAKIVNIKPTTLYSRIFLYKWAIDKAFHTPVRIY